MKSVYLEKSDCCGCSACYNICPCNAIRMKSDDEGFLYPFINQDLCIDCGKCRFVCPFIIPNQLKAKKEPTFFYAKHKSDDVLYNSTSGGAFTAISDVILKNSGVVYGADFNESFDVVHTRAENAQQRDRLRISKYAQSNLTNIFEQVKIDLQNNKKVLFTGTPCQNAGLKGYLGNSSLTKNLYLCDLICHSIPSPLVWKDYIKYLEKTHHSKLYQVKFRTKLQGWSLEASTKGLMYVLDNDKEHYHLDNIFYNLFFGELTIIRPSCEKCPFTDIYRVGDITIADYWGIEKYAPELMDSKGVSVIFVNNEKGANIFEQLKDNIHWQQRDKIESITEQERLSKPIKLPGNREQFWKEYRSHSFEYIVEKLNRKYK